MEARLRLQQLLEDLLGSDQVYFQAPSSDRIVYPAILYTRSKIESRFANNSPFSQKTRYTVTLMDEDPDSLLVDKIVQLPMCAHDRHYAAGQLNHDVFTLYY